MLPQKHLRSERHINLICLSQQFQNYELNAIVTD